MKGINNIGLEDINVNELKTINGGFSWLESAISCVIVEVMDGVYEGLTSTEPHTYCDGWQPIS
jgi:hypothetical protein